MRTIAIQSRFSAYLSGMILGVAALALVAGPHVRLDLPGMGGDAAACAAHLSQDQVESLRRAVLAAEERRDALIRGPSAFAAAKLGRPPDDGRAAAIVAADLAVRDARARFVRACA